MVERTVDTVNESTLFDSDDAFHRVDFVKKAMMLISEHQPEHGV